MQCVVCGCHCGLDQESHQQSELKKVNHRLIQFMWLVWQFMMWLSRVWIMCVSPLPRTKDLNQDIWEVRGWVEPDAMIPNIPLVLNWIMVGEIVGQSMASNCLASRNNICTLTTGVVLDQEEPRTCCASVRTHTVIVLRSAFWNWTGQSTTDYDMEVCMAPQGHAWPDHHRPSPTMSCTGWCYR